jgi:ABC-type oligopeptide transport system substrate-binding subunit/tRNA A-37 threonylcarbamoyl transferase component Bud32/dephospho-CoA kinase
MTDKLIQERYLLGPELGMGGMGTVFRGYDQFLKREVAIKLVTNPNLDESSRQKLLREAQAAAKLNHPNIVAIHDAGYHETNAFIVMELVEGEPVSRDQYDDLEEVLDITTQICSALEHAHSIGIVHRDLKPENVLITSQGLIKLTDFGLARSTSSRLTDDGLIEGTVFYMAPEQALGKAIDHRTDLYSLGVMLYEMTTGQLPFTADDPIQVITQHLNTPVAPPRAHVPELPPSLDKLILGLLKKKPEKRPENAKIVMSALNNLSQTIGAKDQFEGIDAINRIIHGQMVGRDEEMREAVGHWQKALTGESHVLLVTGEAGIGKSRFVKELQTLVSVSGAEILATECYAEGGAPYGPISHLVRTILKDDATLVNTLPDFYVDYLRNTAPELRPVIQEPVSSTLPGGRTRLEAFSESFVGLCSKKSTPNGLLFVLEDIQWSDSGSMYIIRQLARRSRSLNLPLLIVLTYREEEANESEALKETIYELARERLSSQIVLNRLNRAATKDLLNAMLREDISTEFIDGVYRETEGNPFFIEEVCKTLIESGDLHHDGEKWCCFDMERLKIPQSIRITILERLQRLPAETRDSLLRAAVLGREFDFDTLKMMSDLEEDKLINALELAENSQLIYELDPEADGRHPLATSFAFSQKLIITTLIESISSLRRKEIHQRAAGALKSSHRDNLELYALRIGRHLAIAGETKSAFEYLLRAGDFAHQVFAFEDAIVAYHEALHLIKELGEYNIAARTLMKLGLIFHTTFKFNLSREAYREGFDLWQKTGAESIEGGLHAPQTLRTHWPTIITLDPAFANDMYSTGIINQLFRGLVELSSDLTILPDAAVSWDVLDDGKKYVFHLRDDIQWSDGKSITSLDFEYAWKRVLNPETGAGTAAHLLDVKGAQEYHQGTNPYPDTIGVHALDDHTLIVDLDKQTGSFLFQLSMPCAFAVPRHAIEEFGSSWIDVDKIVTSGPYVISAWENNVKYTLSRNERYMGYFPGNVAEIDLAVQSKELDLVNLYEDGGLDVFILGALDPTGAQRAIHLHPDEYLSVPGPTTLYLGYNTFRPPFDNPLVRKAFTHALDREMLVDVFSRVRGEPALGGFVPPGIPGHSEGIGLQYDPEKGKGLLSQAGYGPSMEFPQVRLVVPKSPGIQRRADFLQSQWAENLGVEVTWQSIDLADYLDGLNEEDPDIFMIAWMGSFPDPDDFLSITLNENLLMWVNEEVQKMVMEAKHTPDDEQRILLYQQADRRLIEDAAIMPLSYGQHHILFKPRVKQFPLSPLRLWFWKEVVLDPL